MGQNPYKSGGVWGKGTGENFWVQREGGRCDEKIPQVWVKKIFLKKNG